MNILKSFGIYTVAGILGKVASFLLLPFFTHYLSEGDYGIINIFTSSVYFIIPFMAVGIGETFSVEYPRFTKEEMVKFISTSFFSLYSDLHWGVFPYSYLETFLRQKLDYHNTCYFLWFY